MNNKRMLIISLVFTILIFIVLLLYLVLKPSDLNREECMDYNLINYIKVENCYDAYTKNIFLEISIGNNISLENKINIEFFDFSQKEYDIHLDGKKSYLYKMNASRKPLSLDIEFEDLKMQNYCYYKKTLPINYCSRELISQNLNATISLVTDSNISDFFPVEEFNSFGDFISIDIVDKEKVWASYCQSRWECSTWEQCVDGVQKRECKDSNKCRIPTNIPNQVRHCDGTCEENWMCDWSECVGGYTSPLCTDLNSCGTEYNKPQRIECSKSCTPKINCGDWSDCSIDYNFETLTNFYEKNVLGGMRKRMCVDSNRCVNNYIEEKNCSTAIDVEIREFTKCGRNYVGIFNILNESLIASIEKSNSLSQSLKIDFSNIMQTQYCPYCFNGVKDGDETDIDCGGSCKECQEKRVILNYRENFYEKSFNIIKSFFS